MKWLRSLHIPFPVWLLLGTVVGIVAYREAVVFVEVQLAEHDFRCPDRMAHRELLAVPIAHLAPPHGHLTGRRDCPWGFFGEGAATTVDSTYESSASPPQVLAFYRKAFAARGFPEDRTPRFDFYGAKIYPRDDGLEVYRDLASGHLAHVTVTTTRHGSGTGVEVILDNFGSHSG